MLSGIRANSAQARVDKRIKEETESKKEALNTIFEISYKSGLKASGHSSLEPQIENEMKLKEQILKLRNNEIAWKNQTRNLESITSKSIDQIFCETKASEARIVLEKRIQNIRFFLTLLSVDDTHIIKNNEELTQLQKSYDNIISQISNSDPTNKQSLKTNILEFKETIQGKLNLFRKQIDRQRIQLSIDAKKCLYVIDSEQECPQKTPLGKAVQEYSSIVSERLIRQTWGQARMRAHNDFVVEKMAQKYDEFQKTKTTSSGSLDSTSITSSTSFSSASPISSTSSLSSPDHQTTTSQPVQESPKQPEPKRSWLRSCLDSVVSLFQRKPKKTDVKEVFSREAGKTFLSQVTATISNNSVPLRNVFANAPEEDTRYNKKLFSDFAQRLPRLIEEKEKSDRNFRFLGFENQTPQERAEAVVQNTAILFKEFYEKIWKYWNQFQTELTELEKIQEENRTPLIKAQILNLRKLVQAHANMELQYASVLGEINNSNALKKAAEAFFHEKKP